MTSVSTSGMHQKNLKRKRSEALWIKSTKLFKFENLRCNEG